MVERFCPERLRQVRESVDALLDETVAAMDARSAAIQAVPTTHRASARNLAHYLAVRAHDLRPLQHELAELSLSSLGRMEASVQHTLRGVQCALLALAGHRPAETPPSDALHPERSAHLLAEHTVQLLGPPPTDRRTRILVTLCGAADQPLLSQLLEAGMDLVRINLAHDSPEVWTTMVASLRAAAVATGRCCRILADLPGPKLRTGPLGPGPRVLKVRPTRDALGHAATPVRVVFRDGQAPGNGHCAEPAHGVVIPLTVPLAPFAEAGDELRLIDTRGRRRNFRIESVHGGDLLATSSQSTYLTTDAEVTLCRGGEMLATSHLGTLPEVPQAIDLAVGDALVVTREQAPGAPANIGPDGRVQPARISCTLPEVFAAVQPGQRILFDDGKITGIVEAHDASELHVRITNTPRAARDCAPRRASTCPTPTCTRAR